MNSGAVSGRGSRMWSCERWRVAARLSMPHHPRRPRDPATRNRDGARDRDRARVSFKRGLGAERCTDLPERKSNSA
jgi:hypothetical protein